MSEISTQVFQLTIGCQVTYVNHDSLETSLAGSVLLVEYDHKYKRLSRGVFNTLCLVGDGPGYPNQGCVYVLARCNPGGCVHESLLEETWSGRLLIQEYKKRPFIFLEYLWHDIRKKLGGLLGCMNSW